MALPNGFGVICFVKRGREYHIVMDYKRGQSLYSEIQNRAHMDREEMFEWIRQMTQELSCLQMSKGDGLYCPVTPYNVILTDEGRIALLNFEEENNKNVLKTLRSRSVRQHFQRESGKCGFYASGSDFYGYGRTIQYLFANTTLYPPLSAIQERCFLKIIHQCTEDDSKQVSLQFETILKQIPKTKSNRRIRTDKQQEGKEKPGKLRIICLVVVCICAVLYLIFQNRQVSEAQELPHQEGAVQKEAEISPEANMELGIECFLGQDYSKSRSYFALAGDSEKAVCFLGISEYMLGMAVDIKVQELLAKAQKMREEEPESEYCLSMFRVQRTLGGKSAGVETIRLGRRVLELLSDRNEGDKNEIRVEIHEGAAEIYGAAGELAKEIEEYSELLKIDVSNEKKEAVYRKLPVLYEKNGEIAKAVEIMETAVKDFPYSESVRNRYIRYCCQSDMTRETCALVIAQALEDIKELPESTAFQKLVKEYEITVEGGNVCVGK